MGHKKLLIATRSIGKFPEIISLLEGLPFEFVSLNDVSEIPKEYEVEEPAMTFEGNAIIKAMTFGKKSGLMTLVDDSGLEVDALGGRPGVLSARYVAGTDKDRYKKILEELKSVPEDKRAARFRCVIAVYDPSTDRIRTTDGVFEGRIASSPRGEQGFGYDPIFFSAELQKMSAELTMEEKNAVSHRGKALKRMKEIIKSEFI
jgi:XTP/dITP diphosphohydrolase